MDQRPLLPAPDAALVEVDERERERAEQHERRAQVEARLTPGIVGHDGRRGAFCRRSLRGSRRRRRRGGPEGRVEVHCDGEVDQLLL